MIGKNAFLKKLTAQHRFRSVEIDKDFEGSSPPSVFVGQANYPNVQAGPMLSPEANSLIYDVPEQWLGKFGKEAIINFRLGLVRGKYRINVHNVKNNFIGQMQDIALSKNSVYSHAEFDKKPRGCLFSENNQPFGPSASIKMLETENTMWQRDMENAFYDSDLLARDAVLNLHKKNLGFTAIQKALSVGAFGKERNRKLVPTRWSITATDDMLGKNSMKDVRENEVIKNYRVYESDGLHNYFSVLMTPTKWQYEATEAFINIMGNGTVKFGDYEKFLGRTKYSDMGGCYYAQRFAISDFLKARQEQAGAFVFREVYEGYVPTGVWICRELTKQALQNNPREFKTMQEALKYIDGKTRLGIKNLKSDMPLLQQTRNNLSNYF